MITQASGLCAPFLTVLVPLGFLFWSRHYQIFGLCWVERHDLRCWFYSQHNCISNIDNTSHEEETSNNRRKTKSPHCPQLDYHNADWLAGHKSWRTTQTTIRRYKCAIRESVHSSWYFNILYMEPLLYTTSNVEFCWFCNFYFYIQFDNMYWDSKLKYRWRQITSLYQIAYVQRIRCIKK
jgi:hypothetical protein